MVPQKLSFDPTISPGAKALYAIIDRFADGGGSAWPGMTRLAGHLGVNIETARGYRQELEKAGWLINEGQRKEKGRLLSNDYILIDDVERDPRKSIELAGNLAKLQAEECSTDDENTVPGKTVNGEPAHKREPFSQRESVLNEKDCEQSSRCAYEQEVPPEPTDEEPTEIPEKPSAPKGSPNPPDGQRSAALVVLDYLNARTHREGSSAFRAVDSTLKQIIARLREVNWDITGVRKMIDRQVALWHPKAEMREYLRPSTLFRPSKFNEYYDNREMPIIAGPVKGLNRDRDPNLIQESVRQPKILCS